MKMIKIYQTFINFLYDQKNYIKNCIKHRKALSHHVDYEFDLNFMKSHLIYLHKNINNGYEIEEDKLIKLEKINKCIYLIDNIVNDNFIELAENRLELTFHLETDFIKVTDNLYQLKDNSSKQQKIDNNKVIELSKTLSNEYWNNLWDIIKSSDYGAKSWWI